MSRALSFAIFFSVMLSLVGGAHYYLWARLVRDPGFSPGIFKALTAALVALFVSIPLSLVLARTLTGPFARAAIWVAFVWLGMTFILLVVLGGLDLLRNAALLASHYLGHAEPIDPERRRLLSRILAGTVALIGGSLGLTALRSGLGRIRTHEVRVALERLPSELDGTTIVQLSDVHIGPTLRREFLEEVVRQANALNPDVIAITGDLVDGSVADLREHVAPLRELRARHGVFFVTGNHEYYSGVDEWCVELERVGIRVLRNERVSVGIGDISFDLAGIDDFSSAQFGNGHGPNLPRALDGRDPSRELVLLAHQPRAVFEARQHDVGLQLSGHTHGGQIWPWNFMVKLQQPVVSGLARFGRTWVYVSNGTGFWGPPMRLGAPAEITRVVLLAPAEAVA
ncbi:MAG TPA: metallophosphoesterase [Polyangiaceae bacterium]|nr:metallophosphoesterase [Polyangiaceae bacterium]